jgi:Uma2 family endonuclease
VITSLEQLNLNEKYTYLDYLSWQLKERVELIRGYIVKMSPAPNVRHQRISGFIFRQLGNYLESQNCEVFHAPFDVRLSSSKGDEIDTVVQPDICVICDPKQLDEQGCIGAPTLVIEILSPGNTQNEMKDKFKLYESAGVQEYWLIDPIREFIITYHRNESGIFIGSRPYLADDQVKSRTIPGFSIMATNILNTPKS